jgi:transposase
LNPPEKAVVLCVDEKSQVQALDRTAPILPIRPGVPERQTHDYVRNGTTTLFAALEVATGRVEQACLPRRRHQEFLRFLKQVAKAYPRVTLHLVCDNYATHKHPAVNAWLARNPRITLHFTPTSGFVAEHGRDLLQPTSGALLAQRRSSEVQRPGLACSLSGRRRGRSGRPR